LGISEKSSSEFKLASLIWYSFVAYAFSWAFWFPQARFFKQLLSGSFFVHICRFIAPFGPLAAAIVIIFWKEGKLGTIPTLKCFCLNKGGGVTQERSRGFQHSDYFSL